MGEGAKGRVNMPDERQRRLWDRFREKMGVSAAEREKRADLSRKYWPEDCKRTMKTADEVLEHTFLFQLPWDMEQTQEPVHFPEKIHWKYVLNEDPEFAYQMNRHRYWICLGQAYGLTGEEKYAGELAFQLKDWVSNVPLTEENESLVWRTLEAGLRADYWVRAMALCADSPAMTEEVISAFWEGLEVHAKRLFDNPKTGFSRKSNWGVMEFAGLYVLGFLLDREDYVERSCRYLRHGLHVQVMDDGMHWEASPMYHNEVLMAYLEVLRVAGIWGDEPFSREEIRVIENMAMATMNLMTPAKCQPMIGDSDDTDVRDLLSQGALILKNGQIRAGGFENLDYESIWLFGTEGFREYQELKALELKAGLVEFPDSGQVILRSSWERNADWLYFINGPLGGGHGHQDKLHLGFWMNGEEVLTDSGRYTYTDVPVRYELKAARAHNVPMIRGLEYADSKDTWTYEALPQCFPNQVCRKGKYLFVEGTHGGYEDRGIFIRRRIVAVGWDILAVSDTFFGNEPKEIMQSFHFGETIRLSETMDGAAGTGETCGFEMRGFAEGEKASMELGTAPISRHYNQLGRTEELVVNGKDVRTLTTFLVRRQGNEHVKISKETVCNGVNGYRLMPGEAEGYVIETGSRKIGLVFLHQEVGNQADYNGICGICGLGRTMVCDLAGEPEYMTVLQW